MKLAIQTSRLPGDNLDEKFANARRYGFDAVEVSIGPAFNLAERFDDVKSASASSGVPVSAICTHSIHDPLMPDRANASSGSPDLANLLQLADDLGAEGVVSVPVRRAVTFPNLVDVERELPELAVERVQALERGPARRTVGSVPRAAEPIRSDVASPR